MFSEFIFRVLADIYIDKHFITNERTGRAEGFKWQTIEKLESSQTNSITNNSLFRAVPPWLTLKF